MSNNLNHEQPLDPSQKPGGTSYHRKAARFSLVVSSVCWVALPIVSLLESAFDVTVIYGILLLVSCVSFLAGFVGLFGGKHAEVGMSLLGIFFSGTFGYFDFLLVVSSGLGLDDDWLFTMASGSMLGLRSLNLV